MNVILYIFRQNMQYQLLNSYILIDLHVKL